MLLDPQATAATKGGVAVSVVLSAWVVLVLARSAYAGARVSRAPAEERDAARSFEVSHGAAAIATMILEQLQLMHTLSFATATTSLPRAYTVFLVQFKWANFVVVTSPFAKLGGRCEWSPPMTAISMALELMKLTPEAFFTSVLSCVACLLALTCALNLIVSLWLSSRGRPLPAMWSLPRMQAAVLFATYNPVTIACVVILASSGCSHIYTTVACIVLSCVPCAFICWVLVAIRSKAIESRLVSWRLATSDAERSKFAGVWQHVGQEGQRLKLRLGCVFLQQRGPMVLFLPVDMVVKSARSAIVICCSHIGLPITGALLLAIECARLGALLLFPPYNSHMVNFCHRSSSLGQVVQLVAVFFVTAGSSNRQLLWPIALAVQIVLLVMLALSSLSASHGELVAAQSYYVLAPQPALPRVPNPQPLVLPQGEDRSFRCQSVGVSGCVGALRRATVLVVSGLRGWMRWTSWTSWPWHLRARYLPTKTEASSEQEPTQPGVDANSRPPRSGCIDWGQRRAVSLRNGLRSSAVSLRDGLRFWWIIVCTVLELSDLPALEIIPVVPEPPPSVRDTDELPPSRMAIIKIDIPQPPGVVVPFVVVPVAVPVVVPVVAPVVVPTVTEPDEQPVPDTIGGEEHRQAISPTETETTTLNDQQEVQPPRTADVARIVVVFNELPSRTLPGTSHRGRSFRG